MFCKMSVQHPGGEAACCIFNVMALLSCLEYILTSAWVGGCFCNIWHYMLKADVYIWYALED